MTHDEIVEFIREEIERLSLIAQSYPQRKEPVLDDDDKDEIAAEMLETLDSYGLTRRVAQ